MSILQRPRRSVAFMHKETTDVLHQHRLVAVLVLGPFLILLAFGLGYQEETRPYRTVFVAAEDSPFAKAAEGYADELGQFVNFAGVTADGSSAFDRLGDGDVDIVVVFPDDPLSTVLAGERAPIEVWHNRLDPIELTAIEFAARLAVDDINSSILAGIVGEGQRAAGPASGVIAASSDALIRLEEAVAAGRGPDVEQALADLSTGVNRLDELLRAASGLTREFAHRDTLVADEAAAVDTSVAALRSATGQAADALARGEAIDVARIRQLLDDVGTRFGQFTAVDADVLVRPFASAVESVASGERTMTDFYAPAAIVLLLQQFAVAFCSLTFVRERQLGIDEVFRAAPVRAAEVLVGKYLGYLLLGGAAAVVLTATTVYGLDVPMAGSWFEVAGILGLTLVASIGLGFVISLVSRNDTEAVQYTMITLLASLFFSGMFLPVDQLATPARVISWSQPATFGIELLRDVMLRGRPPDLTVLGGLVAYGAVAAAVALVGTRNRLSLGAS